jgi:hypothetical protein
MNITFDEAENLFEKGCYEEAFTAFANIAENSEYDLSLRSDAYNMMGVIISGSSPYLSDSDESGLLYFKIALQINPENLGAAFNIIETYDSDPTGHQDKEIVRIACKSLEDNFGDKLSEHEKELVEKAYRKLGINEKINDI